MAKLVDVYRIEKLPPLSRRQLPLMVDDNLTMVMDLNGVRLVCDNPLVRGKELDEFVRKFNFLTSSEMKSALEVTCRDLLSIISQTVPCVGCRKSVERLSYQLIETGHTALDPLMFTRDGLLTIKSDQLESPQVLCSMFHGHRTRLNHLVESQPRSKKSHRCNLHSLDSHRSPRPMTGVWRDVWNCMQPQCKEEVVHIESTTLLVTLETYLHKHRFCADCRTKVMRAYSLLIEEPDPCREKGYVPALYAGIKRCLPEKHIHLQTKCDYIGNLITRADLELMGSRRERHAKTLEIAQEEVLTCLGLCVYERLYRIHLRMREEECTCQVLAAVAIEALCRNFEVAVEGKQGVSRLELLFEQITREELAKQQRKEHKRQKRKKKKEKKAEQDEKENNCECESEENGDHVSEESFSSCRCIDQKSSRQNKLQVLDRKSKGSPTCFCKDCQRRKKEKGVQENNVSICPKVKAQVSGDKQQRSNKTSNVHCSSERSSSVNVNNNSIVTVTRNAPPSAQDSVQQSISLSTCESCKNAQVLCQVPASEDSRLKIDSSEPTDHWTCRDPLQDCGYSSENNNSSCDTASGTSSSPEGSEIACSDGFCNHEGDCHGDRNCEPHVYSAQRQTCPAHNLNIKQEKDFPLLTLQQMLEDSCSSDEDGEESYIPVEEVREFKAKMCNVMEQRQELRETLKKRFDLMCGNAPQHRLIQPTECAST